MIQVLAILGPHYAGLTSRKQRVTICEPLGRSFLHKSNAKAQSALIDVMSNQYYEAGTTNTILRNALRLIQAEQAFIQRFWIA